MISGAEMVAVADPLPAREEARGGRRPGGLCRGDWAVTGNSCPHQKAVRWWM